MWTISVIAKDVMGKGKICGILSVIVALKKGTGSLSCGRKSVCFD
jgi:hypothetical protein